jgi:hypothetical protein
MTGINREGIIREVRPIRLEFTQAPHRRGIEKAVLVLFRTCCAVVLFGGCICERNRVDNKYAYEAFPPLPRRT